MSGVCSRAEIGDFPFPLSKESFVRSIAVLLLAFMSAPVFAGDLWEIVSTSVGPDGSPIPNTQRKCLPKDAADFTQMLGELGSCTFDQKNGDASAMTFVMTCKMQGMLAELGSIKVAGDARLNGDQFDMRYTIAMVGSNQSSPGAGFGMTGNLEAHKVGQCGE